MELGRLRRLYVKHPDWSPQELERLRKLYGKQPTSEIAQRLNRSPKAVRDKAARLGLTKKGHGFRRAEEALGLSAKGLTPREIARKMGLKEGSVYTYLYLARHPEQYEKRKETAKRKRKS